MRWKMEIRKMELLLLLYAGRGGGGKEMEMERYGSAKPVREVQWVRWRGRWNCWCGN
jgi:hypothetical protein